MVTCYMKFAIDPYKLNEFEIYAKRWMSIIKRMGGEHHGFFMPYEGGSNNIAYSLFTFPSLGIYEEYRNKLRTDEESQANLAYARETRCLISYERSFMRPVFE
ncbi:NIPSNAP family protein [Clostridium folliculivorans]|uniref:NIPSNAP family containing protein n=1 Tax=Clostridium folliculivorans TaxID=2886038 RepID=A0A9W6DA93_9CLOT|nr:NIPSNAP family protein [Clostridium folliculivorans]GKU24438.1 NIPSNAP family containing protein [Clostridium folliculivorans]GKU30532.1 NIPSNAP family containing protein [Clostridium folliculivorans]